MPPPLPLELFHAKRNASVYSRALEQTWGSFQCVFFVLALGIIHNTFPYRYLRVLHLDNNQILEINGLSGMKSLVELSLNDNCLRSVSGLEGTGLRRLFLAGNEISDVRGVEAVAGTLMHLVASSNEIASLRSIDQLEKLVELDLGGNGIAQTAELQRLRALSHLRVLHIQENPVFDSPASAANDDSCACSDIVCGDSEDPDSAPHTPTPPPTNPLGDSVTADPSLLEETLLSRYSTLFAVPQLTHLNGVEVTRKEKVKVWFFLVAI